MNPIAVIDTVQNLATDKVNTLIENHPLVVITNQMTAEINSKLDKHINDFGITKININHQMELMNNTMSHIRDDTRKIETNMMNLKTELKTEMSDIKGLLHQLLPNSNNINRKRKRSRSRSRGRNYAYGRGRGRSYAHNDKNN